MIQESYPKTEAEINDSQILGKPEENKGIRISDLEKAFNARGTIVTVGLDGTPIRIKADEDSLEIIEGSFTFIARLYDDYINLQIKNEHTSLFDHTIKTKSNNVFPALLLRYILEKWDGRFTRVQACWAQSRGTNTDKYKSEISWGAASEKAALQTWTGRTLANLGYSHVLKIDETDRWIYVDFSKPPTGS